MKGSKHTDRAKRSRHVLRMSLTVHSPPESSISSEERQPTRPSHQRSPQPSFTPALPAFVPTLRRDVAFYDMSTSLRIFKKVG
eukprot:1347902-Amorphochlora_amoeboformis.AAC.1